MWLLPLLTPQQVGSTRILRILQRSQLLGVAREIRELKLGTVALDGTKIHANVSCHSVLSYDRAGQIEAQLKA